MRPAVDIRCIVGAGRVSGTERALPERAADFGGTIGFGFDGPATAPPLNLSFIAATDTGGSIPSPTSDLDLSGTMSLISSIVAEDEGPFLMPSPCAMVITTFRSLDPVALMAASLSGPPLSGAIDGLCGRGIDRAALGVGAGFGLALPAASVSNRDLSEAIDTGASSSLWSWTPPAAPPLAEPERGGVGGAIIREAEGAVCGLDRVQNLVEDAGPDLGDLSAFRESSPP